LGVSDEIRIRRDAALDELQFSLRRFADRTIELLQALEYHLGEYLDSNRERVHKLEREYERCRAMVSSARDSLESCRASEDDDHTPDCSSEEHELERSVNALERARANLERGKALQVKAASEIDGFRRHVFKLDEISTVKINKAVAFLERKIDLIHSYYAVLPNTETITSARGTSVSDGKSEKEDPKEKFPDQWIATRIDAFDLSLLPPMDGIPSSPKVTSEELRVGIAKLQEMKPDIDSGIGRSKEYWASVDRNQGFDYPNGYQKVYDSFYGSAPIRIEKVGSKYEVVDGRHRVLVAQQMGIKFLPVVLVEKQPGGTKT
jgi:hypothetical protein